MNKSENDEMKNEYSKEELGVGVRGKHYDAYQKSKNLVLLSPDVAKAFPTEDSVNEALRKIMKERDGAQSNS